MGQILASPTVAVARCGWQSFAACFNSNWSMCKAFIFSLFFFLPAPTEELNSILIQRSRENTLAWISPADTDCQSKDLQNFPALENEPPPLQAPFHTLLFMNCPNTISKAVNTCVSFAFSRRLLQIFLGQSIFRLIINWFNYAWFIFTHLYLWKCCIPMWLFPFWHLTPCCIKKPTILLTFFGKFFRLGFSSHSWIRQFIPLANFLCTCSSLEFSTLVYSVEGIPHLKNCSCSHFTLNKETLLLINGPRPHYPVQHITQGISIGVRSC